VDAVSASCHFHILNRADPEDSHGLYVDGPSSGFLTDHPPAVGDLIHLSGHTSNPNDDENMLKVSATYRVLARRWMPAGYGSVAWPYGKEQPVGPVMIDYMIELAPHDLFDPKASW
jgi:hypothetical protein